MDGIIIILGSPNDDQGNLSEMATGRLAQGLAEFRRHKGYKILCTGGFGEHFNTTDKPHALYAIRHLIREGVPESDILEIVKSRNTVEDALLSKPIIAKHGVRSLIVVSSDFHMKRVKHIFKKVFTSRDLAFSSAKASFSKERIRALRNHEKRELDSLKKNGIPGLRDG
ncbi:MAG: YdcF family protein [Candidatus Aminicenantes bacterium]|nr:MAG: YdcF family protein [Candidatus Aminicenantes bacterium]